MKLKKLPRNAESVLTLSLQGLDCRARTFLVASLAPLGGLWLFDKCKKPIDVSARPTLSNEYGLVAQLVRAHP